MAEAINTVIAIHLLSLLFIIICRDNSFFQDIKPVAENYFFFSYANLSITVQENKIIENKNRIG